MRIILTLAALSALLGTASGQAACPITSSRATLELSEAGHTFYLVMGADCGRICPPQAAFLYEETNQLGGLQRDDFAQDDTCGGAIAPDYELF